MGKERETIRDLMAASQPAESHHHKAGDTLQVEIAPLAEQMARANQEGASPFLVIFDGMNMGNHIPLNEQPIVLGRDSWCDIVVDDAGISRRHARLALTKKGELEITDLKSTNGTYINGKRIQTATMAAGDKVLFGQRTLAKFVVEDPMDRMYQQELWSSCTRDGLTGISNRSYLKKRINGHHSFALRHQLPYSLTLFKIDNLDEINKCYSMQTGDQVIVLLVRIISNIIRTEDVFSRYDGNKLAILSMGLDKNGAYALALRICQEVANQYVTLPYNGDRVTFRVSAGVVTIMDSSDISTDNVLKRAEENLHKVPEAADPNFPIVHTTIEK